MYHRNYRNLTKSNTYHFYQLSDNFYCALYQNDVNFTGKFLAEKRITIDSRVYKEKTVCLCSVLEGRDSRFKKSHIIVCTGIYCDVTTSLACSHRIINKCADIVYWWPLLEMFDELNPQ